MPKLLQPRRFHPRKAAFVLLVLTAFVAYTTWRDSRPKLWTWSGPTMGTMYTVKFVASRMNASHAHLIRSEVETILNEINAEMSTYLPDSDISRFNASTSLEPVAVSTELSEVVACAVDLAARSGGAFDPTYYPVFKLWGFGKEGPQKVPSDEDLAAAIRICGYRHLQVPAPGLLRKSIPELQFNLNAIAPGYAVERIAAYMLTHGLTNLYVDVGGEVLGHGSNPDGKPWQIGIERPTYNVEYGSSIESVVPVSGRALATSGDYRNFFRDDAGHVYSHIFDPRVGRPVTGRVASVSILATNCMLADALATTLYVMGPDEGMGFLTNYPGTEALFILRESDGSLREFRSPRFPSVP